MSVNTIKAGKTTALMSRLVDSEESLILPADVTAAEYTIYAVSDRDSSDRTAVDGHTGVSLTPADVLFDDLQEDAAWTEDDQGYNFRFIPADGTADPFATADTSYLVVVTLTHVFLGELTLEFYVSTLPEVGGAYYCHRRAVEMLFGASNVLQWADMDNDKDPDKILARIDWACKLATNRINSRLRGGPYTVPFALPAPEEIQTAAARLAGVELYDLRGSQDSEDEDTTDWRISSHRKAAEKALDMILDGRIELEIVKPGATYPQSVRERPRRPYDPFHHSDW
jgi:hypothetical protein